MMPTLLRGDFILVNKYEYGVRLPVLNTKVFGNGKPQRGDVVVFRYPEDPAVPFIKRVVGVPGDHLQYKDKSLTINGKEVDLKLKGIYHSDGVGKRENGSYRLAEQLGELDHDILINPLQPSSVAVDRKIPDGHYFVLGDNRGQQQGQPLLGPGPR